MIVLSWRGVSPTYRLFMYYFLSIYFLSLISESCNHLNLPLITPVSQFIYKRQLFNLFLKFIYQDYNWSHSNFKGDVEQDSISIYYIFTPLEFFTSVLADGFSLEFEWQQVSSSLQDSSQYSGRSQPCCRLDSLHPSANFQVLQAL